MRVELEQKMTKSINQFGQKNSNRFSGQWSKFVEKKKQLTPFISLIKEENFKNVSKQKTIWMKLSLSLFCWTVPIG